MEITKEQLQSCIGKNAYLDYWVHALNEILPEYEINTPQRMAAFIAQTAHESGNYVFLKENLNYKAASLRRVDRKSTRLNSSHTDISRMPSSA